VPRRLLNNITFGYFASARDEIFGKKRHATDARAEFSVCASGSFSSLFSLNLITCYAIALEFYISTNESTHTWPV
jgi:hypothetical protein